MVILVNSFFFFNFICHLHNKEQIILIHNHMLIKVNVVAMYFVIFATENNCVHVDI